MSSPYTIPNIYDISVQAAESDLYQVRQDVVNGQRTASLVFTTDETQHAIMKRSIASAYPLSILVEFWPLLDSTTDVLLWKFDELFAGSGRASALQEFHYRCP